MIPAEKYIFNFLIVSMTYLSCLASYNEQYRVPYALSDKWESYMFNDKEYLVQNLPVKWEDAKILCRGYHNGTLAIVDTRDKAEFLAEALSELQFTLEAVWVGAKRDSAEDPEGYRWGNGVELRRTAADVFTADASERHYPMLGRVGKGRSSMGDLISNPLKHGNSIKNRLKKTFQAAAVPDQIQKLVTDDQRPSQLLAKLTKSSGAASEAIKSLWLSRLPAWLRALLSTKKDAKLEELVEMADKIMESKELSALNKTSPNSSETDLNNNVILNTYDTEDREEPSELNRDQFQPISLSAKDLNNNLEQKTRVEWLNRTHIPVPDGGADCVALERVNHDKPVFLDLPCYLDRPFVCEREARVQSKVEELRSVRCHSGLYRVYDGRMNWNQAAAYCVLEKMTLANVPSMKCLKKLGMTMLKARPSIENAWVGAKGSLGQWAWIDSGVSIFAPTGYEDSSDWPPMRDSSSIKQSGCLQIDRHANKPPVFMEARCERKMQFVCYKPIQAVLPNTKSSASPPSDDNYYYILVRQLFYWQHAFENCKKMNGSLASLDNNDMLIQLLLAMGENKEEPVEHVWIAGRLNMTKDQNDKVMYAWLNPNTGKQISDPKSGDPQGYMPPWLDEEFSVDSPCLNLDREDHLSGLLYGLPCDTPQYSICMIEKSPKAEAETPKPEVLTEEST